MITCSSSNLNNIDKSTPTNYQLIFPKIPTETSIGANNPFIMNIHSAILPSVSLATEELRWQGNKTNRGLIPMEFDPWLVSFVVDSRLANWKLLFNWMSYINNNDDKISEDHTNYSVDCSLVVTDNYANTVLEVIFVSIWPSTLGEVSFSQREGDVLLESTINFNYDYFYVRDTTSWPTELSSSSSSISSSESSSSSSSSSSISSSSLSSSSSSESSSSSSSSSSVSSSSSSSSESSSSSSSLSSSSSSSSSESSSSLSSSESSSSLSSSESSSSSSSLSCSAGWIETTGPSEWNIDTWGSWNAGESRYEASSGDPNWQLDVFPWFTGQAYGEYPPKMKVLFEIPLGWNDLIVTNVEIRDTDSNTIYTSGGFSIGAMGAPEELVFTGLSYSGYPVGYMIIESQNNLFYVHEIWIYENCSSSSSSSTSTGGGG